MSLRPAADDFELSSRALGFRNVDLEFGGFTVSDFDSDGDHVPTGLGYSFRQSHSSDSGRMAPP